VLDFLSGRPAQAVIMSGLIRDNGFESPFNRGTFHACRGAEGGLEGVALVGHAVYVAADTAPALKAFARIAQGQHRTHMILGEEALVGRFWEHYAPSGQPPRLFSREVLYELRWPVAAPEPVAGLRLATLDDLMLVMPVHAALAYEESGVNPIDVDLHGFRMRCARRIEHGRVWVMVEDGNLLFKADIVSDTPECVYLEGVYVEPASRQKGYGLRCLSQLGRALLERTKCVSALVNEQNLAARALFNKAGYKLRGRYDTVFLERAGN
jgi:predicted GNAT family acetyltransferase